MDFRAGTLLFSLFELKAAVYGNETTLPFNCFNNWLPMALSFKDSSSYKWKGKQRCWISNKKMKDLGTHSSDGSSQMYVS